MIMSGIPDLTGRRCPYCNIGRLAWDAAKLQFRCPKCHPTKGATDA